MRVFKYKYVRNVLFNLTLSNTHIPLEEIKEKLAATVTTRINMMKSMELDLLESHW